MSPHARDSFSQEADEIIKVSQEEVVEGSHVAHIGPQDSQADLGIDEGVVRETRQEEDWVSVSQDGFGTSENTEDDSGKTMNINHRKVLPEDDPTLLCQPVAQECPEGLKATTKQHGRKKEWNIPQQNTFLEHKTPQKLVEHFHAVRPANKAETCPTVIQTKDEESQELRKLKSMLKRFNSLFPPPVEIRECPFKDECCNGRHCEIFWKPILKQEMRKGPLCGEDCGYCHCPAHFPNAEWVKLHISRTPAARRRQRKKAKEQIAAANKSGAAGDPRQKDK